MKTKWRPNVVSGVFSIGAVLLLVWVGASFFWKALSQLAVPGLMAGTGVCLFGLRIGKDCLEDISLTIDEEGVEQRRITWGNWSLAKRKLLWGDVQEISGGGMMFRLVGADFDVRIHLSDFDDPDAVIEFIFRCLPSKFRETD